MPPSLAQPNKQAALQTKQHPPSTRLQESRCAMIFNGVKAAAMAQLAGTIMCVLNRSVLVMGNDVITLLW